jgi:hypothetical protein
MKLSINVSLNTKYVYLIKLHPVVMQVLTNCVFPSDSMGSCLYLNYFLFKTTPFPPLHWGVHMAPQLLGLFSRVLNLIIVHVWDHVQISIFSKNIRVGWCGARGICDRVIRVLNTQFFSDHSTMLLPSKQQRILCYDCSTLAASALSCQIFDIFKSFQHTGLIFFQKFDKIQNNLIYSQAAHLIW